MARLWSLRPNPRPLRPHFLPVNHFSTQRQAHLPALLSNHVCLPSSQARTTRKQDSGQPPPWALKGENRKLPRQCLKSAAVKVLWPARDSPFQPCPKVTNSRQNNSHQRYVRCPKTRSSYSKTINWVRNSSRASIRSAVGAAALAITRFTTWRLPARSR